MFCCHVRAARIRRVTDIQGRSSISGPGKASGGQMPPQSVTRGAIRTTRHRKGHPAARGRLFAVGVWYPHSKHSAGSPPARRGRFEQMFGTGLAHRQRVSPPPIRAKGHSRTPSLVNSGMGPALRVLVQIGATR